MSKSLRLPKIGDRFSMLTVSSPIVKRSVRRSNGVCSVDRKITCRCDCGKEVQVRIEHLLNHHTKSCGCIRVRHGMSNSRTYKAWLSMKERCSNKISENFEGFGAIGIGYDPRWDSFNNFLADMGERPEKMGLGLIDYTKDHSKENCRWMSAGQMRKNRNLTNPDPTYINPYD